jgi:hypothetical protein
MPGNTLGRSLKRIFAAIDRPFKFAGHLTFLGIIGAILGSYFQYNSWRDEKNLARYESELSNAISTSSEIVNSLSSVMNLQQMLLFTFANASSYEGPVAENLQKYLVTSAKDLLTKYVDARTNLRQNIDALAGKAALFLDRPVESDTRRLAMVSGFLSKIDRQQTEAAVASSISDFLLSNRDQLREEGFDCAQHMPGKDTGSQLKTRKINWNSVRENIATFYYCLEEIHSPSLLFVRAWAQSGQIKDIDQDEIRKRVDKLKRDIDLQSRRLAALISLSNEKIEALRLKDKPHGFLQHQYCWFCED